MPSGWGSCLQPPVPFVMARLVELKHDALAEKGEGGKTPEHAELHSDLCAKLAEVGEAMSRVLRVMGAEPTEPADRWNTVPGSALHMKLPPKAGPCWPSLRWNAAAATATGWPSPGRPSIRGWRHSPSCVRATEPRWASCAGPQGSTRTGRRRCTTSWSC